MKLDAGEIKDLVAETERKRSNWATWADEWERLWRLCDFDDTPKDYKDLDGVRTVAMPDPFNVVQLLQRFVAHEMRVEVPALSSKEDDGKRSETIEDWLLTFDVISNRQQGCNHSNDMTWQSGVLGRGASQVLWIGDVIPKGTSTDKILPIWRRTLDPRNVGVARGPYWTDYAYHKYKTTRADIEQRYPKYKLPELRGNEVRQGYWNEKYTVVDFWCRHKGSIWHSVTIDDKFAINPKETDYPDIPIFEWYADGAPVKDEMGRSLSILHPIRDAYQTKNDFVSIMMTGMEYHYNPSLKARNIHRDVKFKAGPGEIVYLQGEEDIDTIRQDPNVAMGQALLAILQTGIDQATFPGVTMGDAPGGVNAGFAINNLAQQAQARANTIRQNQEAAMESENAMVLALIEGFAGDEGVEIFKRNARGQRGGPLKLTSKIIKGNYDNQVRLLPERPLEDIQKLLGWSTLVEKGLITSEFFRDEAMNIQAPRDEETRVRVERALKSPQMQMKGDMFALMNSKPQEEWDYMFLSTEYWPMYQEYLQWKDKERQEAAAEKERKEQEKEAKRQQELMIASMGPIMPPMDPSMMGLPGMQDPMMMPPTTGPLPPMSPPGMPGDMSMQPPGQTGLPPQMAGQFDPNALGIPPGAPPGMFGQMMDGQGPTDEELMRGMGGLPPQF